MTICLDMNLQARDPMPRSTQLLSTLERKILFQKPPLFKFERYLDSSRLFVKEENKLRVVKSHR